jgi:hypothetical protein
MYERCCPCCKHGLTLKQAIEILNNSGYESLAKVQIPDGSIVYLPSGSVNPNEVMVLED